MNGRNPNLGKTVSWRDPRSGNQHTATVTAYGTDRVGYYTEIRQITGDTVRIHTPSIREAIANAP